MLDINTRKPLVSTFFKIIHTPWKEIIRQLALSIWMCMYYFNRPALLKNFKHIYFNFFPSITLNLSCPGLQFLHQLKANMLYFILHIHACNNVLRRNKYNCFYLTGKSIRGLVTLYFVPRSARSRHYREPPAIIRVRVWTAWFRFSSLS